MLKTPYISSGTIEELADSCVAFYKTNESIMNTEDVYKKRARLSKYVEDFHRECGTLTVSVQKKIQELRDGNCIVLMTAHQPNLFAYSGVFRKATLNSALSDVLEERLKLPVVSFFGIADQDFTDDRWVRSCELPAVQRRGGLFSIEVKLPEKLMLNKVSRPSRDLLLGWQSEIHEWLDETVRSTERLRMKLGLEETFSASSTASALNENLASFWKIAEDCWERSSTYSDFNCFLISKIVNDVWGYGTVFARFSECQQILTDDFCYLLSHFKDYSKLLKEAKEMSHAEDLTGGVSNQEPLLAPFWYHCSCGSKAKLLLQEKSGVLFGSGNCVGCHVHYELDFGPKRNPDLASLASQISARAIPMGLVFFKGLQPSCYVGGAGGITYLMEAEHVAKGLKIPFPLAIVWRPRDKYLGIGQMEALLELKRICEELDVKDPPSAKNLLESDISDIRKRQRELEGSKKKLLEKLKEHPDDLEIRNEIKRISINQSETLESSHLSVICHELKILANISIVLGLMPSIIDYAVNIGLKNTSDQWLQYLIENGDLSSDVHLKAETNQYAMLETIFEHSVESSWS